MGIVAITSPTPGAPEGRGLHAHPWWVPPGASACGMSRLIPF